MGTLAIGSDPFHQRPMTLRTMGDEISLWILGERTIASDQSKELDCRMRSSGQRSTMDADTDIKTMQSIKSDENPTRISLGQHVEQ